MYKLQEINKIRETAREIYDNMNENKQKYQDYLENNEDLELEIKEVHNTNNNLKQSILKQISENENLQSEVIGFLMYLMSCIFDKKIITYYD